MQIVTENCAVVCPSQTDKQLATATYSRVGVIAYGQELATYVEELRI